MFVLVCMTIWFSLDLFGGIVKGAAEKDDTAGCFTMLGAVFINGLFITALWTVLA